MSENIEHSLHELDIGIPSGSPGLRALLLLKLSAQSMAYWIKHQRTPEHLGHPQTPLSFTHGNKVFVGSNDEFYNFRSEIYRP